MIQNFSERIDGFLVSALPSSVWLWQVRGIVLEVEEVIHPTENPEKQNPGGRLRDLHLKIGDLDHPEDGYDVRIEGVYHQVEPFDVVSLLGHERTDAEAVSTPRLLINHNTGYFTRAYPIEKRLIYGVVPAVEYKYWLSFKYPLKPWFRFLNLWKLIFWTVVPFVVLFNIALPLFAFALLFSAMPLIVFFVVVKYYLWLAAQPKFSFEKGKTPSLFMRNVRDYMDSYHWDLTHVYEVAASLFHQDALDNPELDIGFVPAARGLDTIGALDEVKRPEKTDIILPPHLRARNNSTKLRQFLFERKKLVDRVQDKILR